MTFGVIAQATEGEVAERVEKLVGWMSERVGLPVERRAAGSYEALADEVRAGTIDVAWLPPIVFVRLGDAVQPLGSIVRAGKAAYESALVMRADSKIDSLNGLVGVRAGWIDPWSAAGFVLPRMNLALRGIDPRRCFRTETFHGSHRAAIEALAAGACDVVGTYARADEAGVVAGGWTEVTSDVRVLATFGAIPPDVIGVRSGLAEDLREKLRDALRLACASDEIRPLVRDIFGGDEMREGLAPGYDELKASLATASSRGIFD
ncbi:Phosphonate ABC transporter phosphate-binding periplasmic component [Labilithrix luteola]|uniref:Phosphonate ABC transporter phosphate-binding periplasmic component n=1 Tax=Labilithrix luteola TaxID=1391654 RepID=A0A0K1PV96_9BACT|nr:Phosphonate ABC transporter phosphate-binding periplasmic component [Labilithrix luteola]